MVVVSVIVTPHSPWSVQVQIGERRSAVGVWVRFSVYRRYIPKVWSIAEIWAIYERLWGIPPLFKVTANGALVDDEYVLQDGDEITFHRVGG